jgi:thiol-disulfide isomerase/thioredoxin
MFSLIQVLILVGIALVIAYFIWACRSNNTPIKTNNIKDDTNDNGSTPINSSDNNDTNVPSDSQKYLAVFTAPWCGYCQQFYPTIDQLIEKYKDSDKIKIVPINKDENAALADLHGVKMIPAVKLCMNGLENPQDTIEYKGDRSLQDLVSFVENYI